MNPLTEHSIDTVNKVLDSTSKALGDRVAVF
jgi:hypothetical protein